MKSRLYIFIALLALAMSSCYKDNSNTEIKTINPIVIDTGGAPTTVSAFMLDTLELKPIVYKIGSDDARLSFEWVISGNDIAPTQIDSKMTLKAPVTVPPNANSYTITLTVTDRETGLKNFQRYNLGVQSNMGKGLLVADTKDGENSDLNLIMAREFTHTLMAPYTKAQKTSIEVFSQLNSEKMEGVVTNMVSCYDSRQAIPRTLTVVTDKHAYRMDPYDYVLQLKDQEMFAMQGLFDDGFKPMFLGHSDWPLYDLMIVNGTLYPRNAQWGSYLYKVNTETSDRSPYYITMGTTLASDTYTYTSISFFDELNNRFLRTYGGFGDNDLLVMGSQSGGPFNLNDLGEELTALFMGHGIIPGGKSNYNVLAVMKSRTGSDHWLYIFNPGSIYSGSYVDYEAIAKYPLNGYEGIASAVAYECSPLENILYYAADNKVYALQLAGAQPSVNECFTTASANEKITAMMLWRVGQGQLKFKDTNNPEGYYNSSGQNQMMLIATYDETTGEGKVTAVPIINIGSGTLETDRNFHVVFGGFGRITCMTHQPV